MTHRSHLYLLTCVFVGCAADVTPDAILDAEQDPFASKADGVFGLEEGSAVASEVLCFANTLDVETLDSNSHVGLNATAAKKIYAYRIGPDRAEGTADDNSYDSLAELDAVPYVGKTAFASLTGYASLHDCSMEPTPEPEPTEPEPTEPTEPTPPAPTPAAFCSTTEARRTQILTTAHLKEGNHAASSYGYAAYSYDYSYASGYSVTARAIDLFRPDFSHIASRSIDGLAGDRFDMLSPLQAEGSSFGYLVARGLQNGSVVLEHRRIDVSTATTSTVHSLNVQGFGAPAGLSGIFNDQAGMYYEPTSFGYAVVVTAWMAGALNAVFFDHDFRYLGHASLSARIGTNMNYANASTQVWDIGEKDNELWVLAYDSGQYPWPNGGNWASVVKFYRISRSNYAEISRVDQSFGGWTSTNHSVSSASHGALLPDGFALTYSGAAASNQQRQQFIRVLRADGTPVSERQVQTERLANRNVAYRDGHVAVLGRRSGNWELTVFTADLSRSATASVAHTAYVDSYSGTLLPVDGGFAIMNRTISWGDYTNTSYYNALHFLCVQP